jgi:hypothetical protein
MSELVNVVKSGNISYEVFISKSEAGQKAVRIKQTRIESNGGERFQLTIGEQEILPLLEVLNEAQHRLKG